MTIKKDRLNALFAVRDQATRIGQLDCYSMFVPLKGAYAVTPSALDPDGNELTAPGKPLFLWFAKD